MARDAVIKGMSDGVIVLDMQHRIVDINPAAERATGCPVEDCIGQMVTQALPISAADVEQYREVVEGHEEVVLGTGELRRTYDLRISLLPTRHGRPVGWLLVLRDVTEERLLEKMRDDLTHAMVHDLRNPLTAINAALHLLDVSLHEKFTPSQEQMMHAARNSTQRMLALVGAIMDITQLESGQMPLDKVEIPLDDLVTAVLEEQTPLATERGLRLENGVPSDIPAAWADTRLVRRVLQNLVGNAVKFTPRGGLVRVTARVETSSPHLVVFVSDTGPGIPAEVIDRLFLKFVSGRQEGRGSGLGLAFARMVVEAHGGRIWVEESSTAGTTVAFTLPLRPVA